MTASKIIWTKIDEAPALATYSLLPIVRAFFQGYLLIAVDNIHLGQVVINHEFDQPPDFLNVHDQLLPALPRAIPDRKGERLFLEHHRTDVRSQRAQAFGPVGCDENVVFYPYTT